MLSVHREYQLRNMKILKVCTVSKTVHAFCFIGNKKQAGAKNLSGLKSLTQSDILNDIADEAKEALLEITGGKLADIVFDTTGYHKVLAWAVDLTRVYGKVGLVGDTVNPSLQAIGAGVVSKSISVIGAHGAMTAPYDNPFYPWTKDFTNEISMEYIAQKRIRCDHLISHTVSPEQAPEIYEALLTDRSSYLGVVFDWSLLK